MTTNDTTSSVEIIAAGLAAAEQLQKQIDDIREAQRTQPTRLLDARSCADFERDKALTEEPWTAVMTGFPTVDATGELTGMMPMPTIDGKELFGTRLAFDLLGCCANEAQVAETFNDYFSMVREPDHLFLVAFAALDTIANHVMPALLDTLEHQASDYDSRVRLADAARNAWAARVNDLRAEQLDTEGNQP
jgi:hypothetical protein